MSRFSSVSVKTMADERFFERGTALNRVLLEAPYLPRCSDDKTAALVRPREYAIRYPYMQINRSGMVSWLIFDLDHANAHIWTDVGLPAPNLIVRNRESGHSHLYYAIPPVCTGEKARAKPIAYMRSIYEAMSTRLKADPQFHSGPVAKTPGHPWWQTWEIHNHVYELGELADHVDLVNKLPWSKGPQLESAAHSRHCILFEELRFFAYSVVNRERDQGSFETFIRVLEAYAFNHNSFAKYGFSQDLAMSSVRATVKSVARWTWERYTGSGRCHRGAMQLDKKLPLIERQRLSAQRSTQLRQKATESKIRAACRQLLAQGKGLAQVAIARAAGITRQTVALYKHLIEESKLPATATPIVESAHRKPVVKFGAHQVTAAPEGSEIRSGALWLASGLLPDLPEPSS